MNTTIATLLAVGAQTHVHTVRLGLDAVRALQEEHTDGGERAESTESGCDGVGHLPPQGSVDVILGSDIICQDSDCIGICRAVLHFLKPETGEAVFICGGTRNRYGIDKFPAACEAAGLALEMDPVSDDVLRGIAKNQTHNSSA